MDANRCPKCGRWNSITSDFCETCGERLTQDPAGDVNYQELLAYDQFVKQHNFRGILVTAGLLLLAYPLLKWLLKAIMPEQALGSWQAALREYGPLAFVILSYLMTVLPMLISRVRARRRGHWTLRRLRVLARERRLLPRDFFKDAERDSEAAWSAVRKPRH
jgi:hypothetical protein